MEVNVELKGDGMLAVTKPGLGKRNEMIHIRRVRLSHPWDPNMAKHSSDGNPFQLVMATTDKGQTFVWKDERERAKHIKEKGNDGNAPKVVSKCRQQGSTFQPPCHWGRKEWEKSHGK
eukprot:CAMPEP_0185264426 /NCGR_PEP_ID=MMETSP1359-20130426/22780_1 /TAXON_ID=552665 /ORGANISM="Bigelowiella longifila, Strain CCMP242" /LENGTH=117 /DNA_ID=CAMNT_0027852999 /DNA_START=39 /DNA_END=392 /DNA_ORIENTATION=+